MIPLHELLNRIHWDPEFGCGEFVLASLDKVRHELVCVPLQEVHQEQGSHFCFRSFRIFGGRIRPDTPGKIPSTFHATMTTPLPILSLLETRVLGVLAEKQRTVPDTYPLTLNALVAGCNQKTSRDPIIEASEPEVQAAVDSLKFLSLVVESSGGRVARYAHNIERVLRIPAQSTALLVTLMLRGPQTAGELRINGERLHKFADISSVESFLAELAQREAGGLVVELPRQPGARENRWAHLLSGAPAIEAHAAAAAASPSSDVTVGEIAALKANVAKLEAEVSELRALVGKLYKELGIAAGQTG